MYTIGEDEYGTLVELYLQEQTEVLGGKPAPIPLRTPQISVGLAWNRTPDSHGTATTILDVYYMYFSFRTSQGKLFLFEE
jgi:hypothetical protein